MILLVFCQMKSPKETTKEVYKIIKMCKCNGKQADCKLHALNADNEIKECRIPFYYNGKAWFNCAPRAGKQFCQIGRSQNDWGYCIQTEEVYTQNDPSTIVTIYGNSASALCHFPFFYNGKVFNECTEEGAASSDQKWCATTSNYDNDKFYGFCEQVCVHNGISYKVGEEWKTMQESTNKEMICTCFPDTQWKCMYPDICECEYFLNYMRKITNKLRQNGKRVAKIRARRSMDR